MAAFDIQENLKKLPDCPGVYLHKDVLGQVIYVGKALSLRNRVRQYFQSYGRQDPKVRAMVSHIAEFEYITCATEMEALILECNLIKKYAPKYNILLRDDKTYPYIMVTLSEEYPRVAKTRLLKKNDGNRYFGPYSDAGAVGRMVDLLDDLYQLKRCPAASFPPGHRPCLNYHIQRCQGICTGTVSQETYRRHIEEVMAFLSGREQVVVNPLTAQMEAAAARLDFEEAARLRDLIATAKELSVTQRVTLSVLGDWDLVLPVKDEAHSFVAVFYIREGKLSGRETFPLRSTAGDDRVAMTSAFLKQYYSQYADLPPEIAVEELPEDAALLEEYLSSFGRRVRLFVPQKGEKRALLRLAQRDLVELVGTLDQKETLARERRDLLREEVAAVLEEAGYSLAPGQIQALLGAAESREEYRIESYDISNTNGVDSVGGMVVFQGTQKVRKDYRRFRIKTVVGPDDYASLREMLGRRFRRATAGDPAFAKLPDCIFMDGGLGQVSSARQVLEELEMDVPVVGLAKDDHHRTRAIVFADGHEIALKDRPVLFHYAGVIQEEVHRYAIEYHRNLRGKSTITSVLDQIPGVGPVRRTALLERFGSVEAIGNATVQELMERGRLPKAVAESVHQFFIDKSGR